MRLLLLLVFMGVATAARSAAFFTYNSEGNTTNTTAEHFDHCTNHTDCKHCAGNVRCVWCGVSKDCRRGTAFGASRHACVDYHWMQCTMPQPVFIVLICFVALACCALVVILWCFRAVCCPRSWQSRLPSWNKVKRTHLEELLELTGSGAGARPSSLTGRNTAEERDRLRGKYTEMGLKVNF